MCPNEGRHFLSRNEDEDVFPDLQGALGPPFWSHLGGLMRTFGPMVEQYGCSGGCVFLGRIPGEFEEGGEPRKDLRRAD